MTDVLIVTGPMNSSQLGARSYPWTRQVRVIDAQGVGLPASGIPDQFYYQRGLDAFLAKGGGSIRSAAEAVIGGKVDRLGLCWFSAGHGFASGLWKRGVAGGVDWWGCLDGMYTAFNLTPVWARQMAEAAAAGKCKAIVTASNTTPGTFPDAMTGWGYAFKDLGWEPSGSPVSGFGTPEPSIVVRRGGFAWHGYPQVPHIKQVSTFGQAFCRAFDHDEPSAGLGGLGLMPSWLASRERQTLVALAALGALGGLLAARLAGER